MTYHELTISIAAPFRDAVIQKLNHAGCLGLIDQEDTLVAYFPESTDIRVIANELNLLRELLEKAGKAGDLTFAFSSIPGQDWNENWKKGFVPIEVGLGFTILPPWEERSKDRINLVIDPAMAFGTGHHETTRSCLVLMERHAGNSNKDSFLDLGTGTGILAIAASKMGFHRIVAADTDILAVDATRMNAALNKVEGIAIREGSITGLNETFDFIAANIISGVLVQLAPELAAHLKPGGIAVLSGILSEQAPEVIEAVIQSGLTLIEQYPDGKWMSLAVKR